MIFELDFIGNYQCDGAIVKLFCIDLQIFSTVNSQVRFMSNENHYYS